MMKILRLKERAWTIGITILFLILGYWRASQLPRFGSYEIKTILLGVLPIALLAMGQSIICNVRFLVLSRYGRQTIFRLMSTKLQFEPNQYCLAALNVTELRVPTF